MGILRIMYARSWRRLGGGIRFDIGMVGGWIVYTIQL